MPTSSSRGRRPSASWKNSRGTISGAEVAPACWAAALAQHKPAAREQRAAALRAPLYKPHHVFAKHRPKKKSEHFKSMAPKLGARPRGSAASPNATAAAPSASGPPATLGERARVCLRIRPALTEEEGQDNTALQCDRANRLVWALGEQEEEGGDAANAAPRQYAFDEVLEQHVGQAEVFDIVGAAPVQAAVGGSIGCVLCFGASGAGKDFSLRCERPGQEGLLLRALALIFGTSLVATTPRGTRPAADEASEGSASSVELCYLLLTPSQTVHDLLAESTLEGPWGASLERLELLGHSAFAESAKWETCTSTTEVMRKLTNADSKRTEAQPREGSHTIIGLKLPGGGVLALGSLASIDAMRGAPGDEGSNEALATSIEAAGKCLEALSRSKKALPPVGDSTLTTILSPAMGGAGCQAEGVTALLLCVHPSKRKLALTQQALAFGQLSIAAVTRTKASSSVDYHALAAQLMAQRDAKQEALHELEGKVLRQLRPQLEEVMRQEVEIKQLSTALLQTQWEARTFAAKEQQLQSQLEVLRQEHAQRMYSLRAERQSIMAELQNEMGAVKGGREFAQQRQQHAEDVQAIGARLRSLQSYVETAEAELSQHEENSTKARAVLPGAARELATLALTFSEDGNQGEAAGLFAHSLTILEAAFGSAQPELAAFKSEVQRVVDSGAQNAQNNGVTRLGGPRGGRPERPDFDA